MATKKQDVLTLLDKAVGKKGPLRIPAYWMREVLLKIMDWAEGLTPKVDVPTKISQLENDMNYVDDQHVSSAIRANKTDMNFLDFGDLYYKSRDGLNYGIIDSSTNPFKATLSINDLGYIEYKVSAFVKSLKIPEFNIDLQQGVYLFTISYYVMEYKNTLFEKLIDISYGHRGLCSWVECESQDNGFFQLPEDINDYQFGFPALSGIVDGTRKQISSRGFNCDTCIFPMSGNYVDLDGCFASKVRVSGDASVIRSTYLHAKELYLDCDVKSFDGTNAFSTNTILTKIVFTKNTTVPSSYKPVTLPTTCVIVVPDALYDEWVTNVTWTQVASQIVKASEYTE